MDQSIYKYNCGPTICCIVHSIFTSYCNQIQYRFVLYVWSKETVGFDLFSRLNARCYTFRVHFRELCRNIWICKYPPIDCSSLSVMKRPKNTRIVDTSYKPSTDDSLSSANDDSSTFQDSDCEEVQELRKEVVNENLNYTLNAGTIITFTPESVFSFGTVKSETVTITMIKLDWENEQYLLLLVYPYFLVSKNRTLRAKGKKYMFILKDIKMEPGSFEVEKNSVTTIHLLNYNSR